MPELEQRFGCEVTHLSGVTALVYGAGDHFAAHSDGGGDDDAPDEVRRRRVSVRSSPGLLIAFASSMIHRVAPVATGRRYSLALWAPAPSAR